MDYDVRNNDSCWSDSKISVANSACYIGMMYLCMTVTDKCRLQATAVTVCAGKVVEKDEKADGQAGRQGYLSVSQRLDMTHPL